MNEALSWIDWLLLMIAAMGIGFSKSGFAGVSLFHVVVFASLFEARISTGIVLPLLVLGDLCAVYLLGKRADRKHLSRLLPPALLGVVLGTLAMWILEDVAFKPIIGGIILGLASLQLYRMVRPYSLKQLPHSPLFAFSLGLLAGITTMLANAAGPIVALYLMAVALPKDELVATSAWIFLIVNIFKLPFSLVVLNLISKETLAINLVLAPAIPLGLAAGAWCLRRINQYWFNLLLLAFTVVAAVKMLLLA